MDWYLLFTSTLWVLLGVVILAAVIRFFVWVDDITGGLGILIAFLLFVFISAVLAVYAQRGGFDKKPAEATQQEVK